MKPPPEKLNNEIYLGNSCQSLTTEPLNVLKTIRRGIITYDLDGKKFKDESRPLFINKSEFQKYDDIMNFEFDKICRKYVTGNRR